jgi:hypothetical protein
MKPALLAGILALFLGCTSPEQKAELAARTIHSWNATLSATTEALERGSIPRVYARQVLRAAMETRQQQSTKAEWHRVPAELKGRLDRSIARLATSLGESPNALQHE